MLLYKGEGNEAPRNQVSNNIMRTIEEIAQSVHMDTNIFKNMLEAYKQSPAFFGGELASALEEAKQNAEVKMIPLTYRSISDTHRDEIEDLLCGTDMTLVERIEMVREGLTFADVNHLEEALIRRLTNGCLELEGFYFESEDELIAFVRENITLEL